MKRIARRELQNRTDAILREVEGGHSFTITVNGRPVALLVPFQGRQWVPRAEVIRLLRGGDPDPDFFVDVAEASGIADFQTDPWERPR